MLITELLSDRIQRIPYSSIREVFEEAGRLEKEGVDVTHMEIGRPDFDTPPHIKSAAVEALGAGQVHYTSNHGILELRQAISEKLALDNGMRVDPEAGVVVTVGCTEAVLNVFLAYVNRGDEVLVPEPAWLEYARAVELLDGHPVPVPLRMENGFVLDPEDVAKRITPRTKMLVLCSPHNPTGAVLDAATLVAVAGLCKERNLLVLSDEIYEKLVYDDAEHLSIGSLPGMFERTITINGFSKAYAMDGWRLGYAAGDEPLIQPILKAHQYTTVCTNTFAQFGAIAAYRGSQGPVCEMVREFDRRRRFLVQALNDTPGISCVMPKGAFYAFPALDGYERDSRAMVTYLLREAQIACVPGSAFGASGEGHIRIAYSTNYESITAGMARMRTALAKLEK